MTLSLSSVQFKPLQMQIPRSGRRVVYQETFGDSYRWDQVDIPHSQGKVIEVSAGRVPALFPRRSWPLLW